MYSMGRQMMGTGDNPNYPYYSNDNYRLRIRQQIEYYFSMENLFRDYYLRSQMDADGWVSLEVLAGFNRLKYLLLCSNDPTLLMLALHDSDTVELDQTTMQVRRKDGFGTNTSSPSSGKGRKSP